jgi:hypothetical protein
MGHPYSSEGQGMLWGQRRQGLAIPH